MGIFVKGIRRPGGREVEVENGGSLPEEWTIGTGTEAGSLDIQTDQLDARIRLRTSADHNSTIDLGVADGGGGAVSAAINVESQGGGGSLISLFEPGTNGGAFLDGRGGLEMFTHPNFKGIDVWDQDGNVQRFGLLPTAGQVMIGVLTAPPDGDLSASQLAFWFDDTDGAANLMLKGKSANGTVVTGSVNLS